MSKYHIGFIGTGGRSVHYARHYAARDDMEIVALADPLPHNRKVFSGLVDIDGKAEEFRILVRNGRTLGNFRAPMCFRRTVLLHVGDAGI